MDQDISVDLQDQLQQAIEKKTPLRIEAGKSKSFYGHPVNGEVLDISPHRGVVRYEPSELFITARAGTPLKEIESVLAQNNQSLAFDPPFFNDGATLGGVVASGLAGPSRPYSGSVRDFVLGCTILTGKGDVIHFGGEVMKNVAGYDVSRLMVGALGTLGVLLEVSLKILPKPAFESTRIFTCDPANAIQLMNQWAGQPVPLTGACYDGEHLYLRLSGAKSAVVAATKRIGGEELDDESRFWHQLRDQELPFFDTERPLWRLSLGATTPPLDLTGDTFLDWGGAQRWLVSDQEAEEIRALADSVGGHATLFRNTAKHSEIFHPLSARMRQLHLQLKQTFDPFGLLNYGRLYPDL